MRLQKCLIANRGEIALRLIRACRELGIIPVAVYAAPDADALHVQSADAAYPIPGYLDGAALVAVARDSGCDCVHPGYGFLAESPDFAEAVQAAGRVWVGPSADAIRLMGVKTEARARMQAAGVPVVPGYQADTADDAALIDAAESIGWPLMVKAAGGGGGKGIRIVREAAALPDALAAARHEAQHAFGDPRLFLERYIEAARHIEVQILADTHGHTLHLYERECSTQRRHQKIVEESPSPLLDAGLRERMGAAAVSAAQAVGYINAGTVEFIATADGDFYFLEMNTRLQVEHPVTEMVTGVDIVKWQFRIAAGEALDFTQADVIQRGHAIECRIYAEDAHNGFLPVTGPVLRFDPPVGPGIRVDAGVRSGDSITIHYDPLIAKLIVFDSDRDTAIRRMRHALAHTVILGTTTNIPFLRTLLAHPAFIAGEVDTGFVDAHLETLLPPPPPLPDLALIAAALSEMDAPAAERPAAPRTPWDRADGFRL